MTHAVEYTGKALTPSYGICRMFTLRDNCLRS